MRDQQLDRHFFAQQPQLLESLYGGLGEGGNWDEFLQQLVDATQSRSARMLLLNAEANQVLHSTKVNIDSGDHQRYVDYYVNTCPWRLELAEKPSGRLYSTYLDFSCRQDAFYQTEFYNDWASAQDIHHGICGTVFSAGSHRVQLLVQRTRGQGHYSEHATGLVNGLLPHLRQALRLEQLAAEMDTRAQASVFAAQARPLPFVLLDQQGRVVMQSPRAESILRQNDISTCKRELRFREAAVAARFWRAFKDVLPLNAEVPAQEQTVYIRRDNRPTLSCFLTPIAPQAGGSLLASSSAFFCAAPAHVALYIYDPEQLAHIDLPMLMRLFQLTESEARVARDIAQGMEPQAIALRDQRSAHTVRAQLKSIFTKMRCNRQNQVAALILQSPAVSWQLPE